MRTDLTEHDDRPLTVIAVFNSSDDMIELLRIVFEQRGYIVVTGHVDDVIRGKLDLQVFAGQHRPAAVVYDLTPPYDRHWRMLNHVRTTTPLAALPFVLTTTNVNAVRQMVGIEESLLELHGRPFEYEAIVDAVARAVAVPPELAS